MAFPYKWFRLPWAVAGTKSAIPDPTQGDGSLSYNEGFGVDYSLDPATNPSALLIPRDKTNELYYDITQALQYFQSGQPAYWIDATTNGGSSYIYDINAVILYTDGFVYRSLVPANTTTPGTDITKWQKILPAAAQRQLLFANTTFYVSITGSDASGLGTVGSPWRTAQFASDTIQKYYDLNGYIATIQRVASTSYTDPVLVNGPYPGATGPGSVVFASSGGSASTTVTTAGTCYAANFGASFTVSGQKLVSGGVAIQSYFRSYVTFTDINFGACGGYNIDCAYNSVVATASNFTISGNCAGHALVSLSSTYLGAGLTVSLTGSPVWSSYFMNCLQNANMNVTGNTYSGAATGTRFNVSLNGVIICGGSGTYFPGSVAGIVATGGQYA